MDTASTVVHCLEAMPEYRLEAPRAVRWCNSTRPRSQALIPNRFRPRKRASGLVSDRIEPGPLANSLSEVGVSRALR